MRWWDTGGRSFTQPRHDPRRRHRVEPPSTAGRWNCATRPGFARPTTRSSRQALGGPDAGSRGRPVRAHLRRQRALVGGRSIAWEGVCQRAEKIADRLPQPHQKQCRAEPAARHGLVGRKQAGTRPAILVHNKCDLPIAAAPRPAGLLTSALRGDGIESFGPPSPADSSPIRAAGGPCHFTPEQVEMVRRLAGD